MSFTRVNPGSWAIGDVLTSAQQNQLDIDHAKALDKSAAGDTLAGPVVVPGGESGGSLQLTGVSAVVASAGSSVLAYAAGAITSVVNGGIACMAGPDDWVALSGRTRTIARSMRPADSPSNYSSAWSLLTGTLDAQATTTAINLELEIHDGATLASVKLWFQVQDPHTDGLPAVFPSVDIQRLTMGSAIAPVSLFSGGAQFMSASTSAAWYGGGTPQSFVVTPNQNAAIDATQYRYLLVLTDENGTHAKSGNVYFGTAAVFTSIASSRFP